MRAHQSHAHLLAHLAALLALSLACSASRGVGATHTPQAGAEATPAPVTAGPTSPPTASPLPELPGATAASPAIAGGSIAGCPLLPPDNIWNARVDSLPVLAGSDQYIDAIGRDDTLHADFGSGDWPPGSGAPIGIPYATVPGTQPGTPVTFEYAGESDPGPYPIPDNPPIEGGPGAGGDRHLLIVDRDNCLLYEIYRAELQGGGWFAGSGAIFDLSSNALRPDSWTSADAAGLPILPGLVRYDEVAAGEINHAIRFTAPDTRRAYVWPARHFASDLTEPQYPPMGQRFRLRAGFDISPYPAPVQVILRAFQRYGLILADNGSPWYISGVPDERWDNDMLHAWDDIPGSAFEAVDVSSLMLDPDSGQVRPPVSLSHFLFLPLARRQ